jgi:hypothetical protein
MDPRTERLIRRRDQLQAHLEAQLAEAQKTANILAELNEIIEPTPPPAQEGQEPE